MPAAAAAAARVICLSHPPYGFLVNSGESGGVPGALGAVLAGELEGGAARAPRPGRGAGGAVGFLGRVLGPAQQVEFALAGGEVGVEGGDAVGDAQRGQRGVLGPQPPQPLLGRGQLGLALTDAGQRCRHPLAQPGQGSGGGLAA